MPRYVVLAHDHPFLHWDLMLEQGEVLRTWRLLQPPGASSAIPAEPLADHRTAYLDYEGPVSGGRGTVTRIDRGDYELVEESTGLVRLSFFGGLLSGECRLLQSRDQPHRWQFHSVWRDA